MIRVEFTPWGPFHAKKDAATIHSWLESVAKASEQAFRSGASRPWPGDVNNPWDFTPGSKAGEWPMRRTGNLLGSIKTEVSNDEMTIGTGMPYSVYLREGTRRMKGRRKMSDDALKMGLASSRLGRWVMWSRG
jgi:phage gpG-like protein